jgi:hypothetical protein
MGAKYTKVSHAVLARTFALLRDGALTAQRLSRETGVHVVTAQDWLRALKEEKAVHIGSWLPDSKGRDATPVYELGDDKDEPRRRMTRAEISRRYRQRQKLKGEM